MASTPFLQQDALRPLVQRMPADQRAAAACVCRAWRDACQSPEVWTTITLGEGSGVECAVTPAVVLQLVKRSRGKLLALDVSGCESLDVAALLAATAHAPLMTEFRAPNIGQGGDLTWSWEELQQAPPPRYCSSYFIEAAGR